MFYSYYYYFFVTNCICTLKPPKTKTPRQLGKKYPQNCTSALAPPQKTFNDQVNNHNQLLPKKQLSFCRNVKAKHAAHRYRK